MKRINFALGTPDGPRSLVWWVTADKGEVYVGAREIHWWKGSLHRSGSWHLRAHAEGAPENIILPDDRVFSRWQRPQEMFPRLTAGLSIHVPHEAIVEHEPVRKKVEWCTRLPKPGEAAVFSVMLGEPRTESAELTQEAVDAGIERVGEIQVDEERRAWVFYWIIAETDHERQLRESVLADEARGESWALWRSGLPDGGEKIVVNGENRTARASRYLAELIVRR